MYKLLIADDEKSTREGLRRFFEREPNGFQLVGVVDGGLPALAMAQEHQPDLLLTDVRMPDIDGLSLARRCAELPKPPHLLIMSSYVETQYMKSALKLHAMNYLIKPIDLTELRETLQKIRQQLDAEVAERARKEKLRIGLNHSRSWLRGHFLEELLDGVCTDTAEIQQQMDFLDMELPEIARYGVLSVRIDSQSPCFTADMAENKKKMYSLRKLLEDILSKYAEGYVFERTQRELVVLAMERCEASDEPDSFARSLETVCQESFSALAMAQANAAIGLGKQVMSRHQLPLSYRLAHEDTQARLSGSSNVLVHSRPGSPADQTVEKICAIIQERYQENLTIQSIAEQIYLSPNYICMVFKQATGQTINQYTTQVRMEQAKKLLAKQELRITDIGASVGYAEPGYFNKLFKKYAALTPKEYRQMVLSTQL